MLVADKLTPEVLLGTATRRPAVPNHDGNLALYTTSTHTLGQGTTNELRVMTLETGSSRLISNSDAVHDATWLGDGTNSVIFLEDGEKGSTLVKILDVDELGVGIGPVTVGIIHAPAQALRVKLLDRNRAAITVVSLTDKDGSLYNEEESRERKPFRGQIYDNFRVRLVRQCPPSHFIQRTF